MPHFLPPLPPPLQEGLDPDTAYAWRERQYRRLRDGALAQGHWAQLHVHWSWALTALLGSMAAAALVVHVVRVKVAEAGCLPVVEELLRASGWKD